MPRAWMVAEPRSWATVGRPCLGHCSFCQGSGFLPGSHFVFLGLHLGRVEVPRPGVESELHLRPTPQPQQCGILNPLSRAGD